MRRVVQLIVIAFGCAAIGTAQVSPSESDSPIFTGADSEVSFIESARRGTSKYQDRDAAIADGYRIIGSDFPAMGEHWINIPLLFDSEFDPERPEVLSYVVVSGEPRLLGVAYAMPLLAGESAPDWPHAGAWHDHYRTLDDETTSPEHHMSGGIRNGARMAMLHAWIWAENPNGMFAADNWAIPYLRLGIPIPDSTPETAAKALSLLSGGGDYYTASLEKFAAQSSADQRKVESVFARAEAEVERLFRDRVSSTLTADETAGLSEVWERLWNTIDDYLDGAERLQDPVHSSLK